MSVAYIVDALRTPVGKKKGALAAEHPADLGAHVLKALVEKTKVDPSRVDDVIFGCVDTIGPQAGDIARTAWLAAGLPDEVPGIAFLSGGQTSEEATAHLSSMNEMGPHPWQLTFSYGRALQAEPLKAWSGEDGNIAAAQETFIKRSRLNSLARTGNYHPQMEEA